MSMVEKDGAQNILDKVTDEAVSEIRKLLEEGEKSAIDILSSSGSRALEEAANIIATAEREGVSLERRVLGRAEMAARNKSLQLIEETVEKTFKIALERISSDRSEASYRKSLVALISEGVDALGGNELVVAANSSSQKSLKTAVGQVEKLRKIRIKIDRAIVDTKGGVVMRSIDGSRQYDNTVEARLLRLKPLLRRQIVQLIEK
ncbi:MAG: hypothetical protein CMO12_02490 [Thaumarchaeota archaeon]|jgi:V/A-type H+-transporting ATPase subunit E|nr:hypothetical protein [Nitrososphaerota archaeon]|tara:strand:+ start:8402 stop:9016 length:615 start_codon:yes stop_codon:yes gene_type:complete